MPGRFSEKPSINSDGYSVYGAYLSAHVQPGQLTADHPKNRVFSNLAPQASHGGFFSLHPCLERKDDEHNQWKESFSPRCRSTGAVRSEALDWMKFEPPQELLRCQAGSSEEVKNLLLTAMERVRARQEQVQHKELWQIAERSSFDTGGKSRKYEVSPEVITCYLPL
jgi:hypothetical protein